MRPRPETAVAAQDAGPHPLALAASGAPLEDILRALVELVERMSPGMIVSILLYDGTTRCLHGGVGPSLPDEYLRALEGAQIGPQAGSCGTAAYRRERVVVDDIATHPYWNGYRELALPHGLRACWSTPIFSPDGELLGTFAMYYRQPRVPKPLELAWVDRAVQVAGLAIGLDRTRSATRAGEARAHHLARLYAVSTAINEALVRGRGAAELYDLACRIAVERGLARLAWVGAHDKERDEIRTIARFGHDAGYLDTIRLRVTEGAPDARGPAARALRSGTPAVSNDIAEDPGFRWLDEARARGLLSCAAFPIRLAPEGDGVLVIYGGTTDFFHAEELRVLTALAQNISFAVGSAATEKHRDEIFAQLTERVKELTFLHLVADALRQDRPCDDVLLREVVDLLPAAMQHADVCEARITCGHLEVRTSGWTPSDLRLTQAFSAGPTHGVIEVVYREARGHGDPFLDEERRLLRSLGDMLVSKLRREHAEKAARERAQGLRVLHDLGEVLRLATDPDEVLPEAMRVLGEHLGVARCQYAEVSDDGDTLVVPHEYTVYPRSMVGEYRLSDFGRTVADAFRRGGAPVVIRDVDRELPDDREAFRALDIGSFVCCSLVREGRLRALVAVHHATPRVWTASEVAIIQTAVDRCWETIEKRAAEARLRASESQLRIASAAARLGGWSLDVFADRLIWSDEVREMHGLAPGEEPAPADLPDLYGKPYAGMLRDGIEACVTEGRAFDLTLQMAPLSGVRRWVRVIGRPERLTDGTITAIQGAYQDVSDRRELESQLLQSQKLHAIGQLAGGIAHDFNNLLSVILGYASLNAPALPEGDPVRCDLEEVAHAARRASELTHQLLAFGRRQVLEPRVVRLSDVVADVDKMLRRLVGADITVSVIAQDDAGHVFADKGQIEQVIVNLVVNARDAMPFGGAITIETGNVHVRAEDASELGDVAPGAYVMLSVADTGVGMDVATVERIFEPFYTTKEVGKGTGLGLSTVWGIVSQSGGRVLVESEVGRGSTFRVYLPRVDRAPESEPAVAAPSRLRGSESILLVEDDDQLRALILSVLRRYGYTVLEARDGREALLIAEQHDGPIHLLLADVVLPRLSGARVAEQLSGSRPGTRVVFMSGYADQALAAPGPASGEPMMLPKPFTPDGLLRKVRHALDGPSGSLGAADETAG